MSAYGLLTREMRLVLSEHVKNRIVHDLGAGDMTRSCELSDLGASSVVAVDKRLPHPRRDLPGNVFFYKMSFKELLSEIDHPIDVAFVAWPFNAHLPGLLELLTRAKTVIYLGINDEGTACGWSGLFTYLSTREVLAEVNHPRNDLLIYGSALECKRRLRPEESRGLSAEIMPWSLQALAEAIGLDRRS